MPLINCEVSLILTWSENWVLTDIATQAAKNANPNADPLVEARERIDAATSAIFEITDTKLYVPVATLSTEGDNNFLEQLKSGFKSNKYRSKMTNQTKTNNFNYLIDPMFTKVSRLFALSFKNEEDRTSFSKYYTSKLEIKDFNVLIDGKSFMMCK